MGYNAKGKSTIGASVDKPLADYLRARGERLDKTQSWALARIVNFWIRCGAPPLSQLDEKLDQLPIPPELAPEEGWLHALAAEGPGSYNQKSAADVIQDQMAQQIRAAQDSAKASPKPASRSPRK